MSFIKDKKIYIYLLLFMIISFLSIYKASIYLSPSLGKLYYKQIIWFIFGFIIIYLIKKIDLRKIYNISFIIYLINVILLISLFFFGVEINNTKAWFKIFSIYFQPSEFMKISIILLNSYVIHNYYKNKEKINNKKERKLFIILFFITIIPSILTFIEPDTGAIIGYFIIFFSMLYISGINKKIIINLLFFLGIILLIISFIYFFQQKMFIKIFGNSLFYRIDRITNWKNKSGMQLNNSLIAIGSSGLYGHQYVPLYYPEAGTDFIFTSFSSSFGYLGSIILLSLFFSFDLYMINILKNIKNRENKYTLFGIISLFIYQQVQNIGMTLGLLPIIGITLPLISYGGSSLLSYFILIGIVENIKKRTYK